MKKLLLAALLTSPLAMAQPAPRYEYGQIINVDSTVSSITSLYHWTSAHNSVVGADLSDFLRALVGRRPMGPETPMILILNWAGEQGWELVSVVERASGGVSTTTYFFKRVKR